jgi:hypothetical protein
LVYNKVHFNGGSMENHENFSIAVPWLKLKPGTSWVQNRNVNHYTTIFSPQWFV